MNKMNIGLLEKLNWILDLTLTIKKILKSIIIEINDISVNTIGRNQFFLQ